MMPGAQCASLAASGNLLRSNCSVFVVNMRPPAGWMIVFVGSCNAAMSAEALVESRVTFAAESSRTVVSRFGGLVQPDFEDKLFTRLLLIK